MLSPAKPGVVARRSVGARIRVIAVAGALLCVSSISVLSAEPAGAAPQAQVTKKKCKSKKASIAKKKCKKAPAPTTTVPPVPTTFPTPTGPLDTDGDGIADTSDNCATTANHDQTDTDADGHGDACDPCPTDSNPGTQGCPTTIYLINDGTVDPGRNVRISNVLVTATSGNRAWVQVKQTDAAFTGFPYSGLEIDVSGVTHPALGDRITIDGIVGDQILTAAAITTVSSSGETPSAPSVNPSDFANVANASQLNGSLVDFNASPTLDHIDGNGDWVLNTGTVVAHTIFGGPLPTCAVGSSLASLLGIADIVSGDLLLLPRDGDDLGPPCLTNLNVPATLCVGQTSLGSVTLSGPVPSGGGSMFVSLTSSDPTNVPVPSAIGVLEGQSSHTIGFTPTGPANNVTITATLNGGQTQAVTSAVNC
jgi:hypothetical protein